MIQPISLPAAAGIDYSKGDVRHFAQGDAVDVPSISNPTRELAQRDNLLAAKLNEVVGRVNNTEQYVPLPVVRTIVAPSEEVVVTNYRIPAGFEARVLDVAVGSTPQSSSAQANIYYNSGFGGSTGTVVVTATPAAEFTGEVNFFQTGEFVISLKNLGSVTLEISASIMLTMRPLGTVGTLLIGTVVEGPQGLPGVTGPQGPAGPPGSGGAGTPGMVWTGTWNYLTVYNVNDVAAYTESTGQYSSFICLVANTGQAPEGSAYWDYVVQGGAQGESGPMGVSGSSIEVPTYASHTVDGTIICLSNFTGYSNSALLWQSYYQSDDPVSSALMTANGTYYFPVAERFMESSRPNLPPPAGQINFRGMGFLNSSFGMTFTGNFLVSLPTTVSGARTNYTNDSISCVASAQGSVYSWSTVAVNTSTGTTLGTTNATAVVASPLSAVAILPLNGTDYYITNTGQSPICVDFHLFGAEGYF